MLDCFDRDTRSIAVGFLVERVSCADCMVSREASLKQRLVLKTK